MYLDHFSLHFGLNRHIQITISLIKLYKYVNNMLKVGASSANFIPILLKYFLNYQSQFLKTKRISFTKKVVKRIRLVVLRDGFSNYAAHTS